MKKILFSSMLIAGLFINKISAQVVLQSDFETWTGVEAVTGWDGSATNILVTGDSARKDSIAPKHGLYCVKLVNISATAKRFSTQPIAVASGSIYTMRFWAKGAGSIRTGLDGVKPSTGFGYEYNSYITVNSPTWTVYTQTLMADSTNSAAQFLFSIKSTIAASGNLDIDSVTITKIGTAPTESLYNVQYTTATPANSPYMNQFVNTGGIVTAVYNGTTSPPSQSGYYVQTSGAHAWSAVNVYDYSHPVAIGDSVTFSGMVVEYYNETEIQQVCNFTKVSSGNQALTPPTVVGLTNIQNEKYEGLLIKAKDITEVRYNAAQKWYVFSDSTTGIDTVDNFIYTYSYTQGKKYNITGVVKFEYAFWIAPRNIGDIDSINVTSTTGISTYKNEFSDMNIYPNPNNGVFTVSLNVPEEIKNTDVLLTDLTGRLIHKERLDIQSGKSSLQINTTGIEKGTYFLEISNSQARTVKKIIVQ